MATRQPAASPAPDRSAPQKTASRRDRAGLQLIDLALQGGGSHGAFTWGVLDRLLDDESLEIAAISGTSAGAMNAVALAAGLMEGGREGARTCLARFWKRVAEASPFTILNPVRWVTGSARTTPGCNSSPPPGSRPRNSSAASSRPTSSTR